MIRSLTPTKPIAAVREAEEHATADLAVTTPTTERSRIREIERLLIELAEKEIKLP